MFTQKCMICVTFPLDHTCDLAFTIFVRCLPFCVLPSFVVFMNFLNETCVADNRVRVNGGAALNTISLFANNTHDLSCCGAGIEKTSRFLSLWGIAFPFEPLSFSRRPELSLTPGRENQGRKASSIYAASYPLVCFQFFRANHLM